MIDKQVHLVEFFSIHIQVHLNFDIKSNSSPPRTRWPPFRRRHVQMRFLEWKYANFKWNFIEICSLGSNGQYAICQHWFRQWLGAVLEWKYANFKWNFIEICSLGSNGQYAICQHWFRQWLGAVQATSHYLNQCWPTHICGNRGRMS